MYLGTSGAESKQIMHDVRHRNETIIVLVLYQHLQLQYLSHSSHIKAQENTSCHTRGPVRLAFPSKTTHIALTALLPPLPWRRN